MSALKKEQITSAQPYSHSFFDEDVVAVALLVAERPSHPETDRFMRDMKELTLA